ncbi:GNAT family N-acetyltransferase [Goekera deserti]|uniref:GNAT family N-acetyltransferase n=1 Tax=Goekera deserti TaxID=2497753 RepID=UPI001C279CD9|nr:GNAT family N-acetyltransferase [Goekera deserti]
MHPLDHAAWTSLTGPHAGFAVGSGTARRYRPDVSPFVAVSPDEIGPQGVSPAGWRDLVALLEPAETVVLFSWVPVADRLPAGLEVAAALPGLQMTAPPQQADRADPDAVELGSGDVDDMLDLVARTEPGPFLPRTRLLGRYLGVRIDGRLVAMAGERMHPPGWTEISAVCTDPAARGRGLAARLVGSVAAGIRARGERPLLHVSAANTPAVRLYEHLGFQRRGAGTFTALRRTGG